MTDSKTKRWVVGTVLSTAASYFGGYLFESPLVGLSCLVAIGLLFAGGSIVLSRYEASGQRQSRPVKLN
ncbi:hypothetical protein ACVIGB_000944 [Bradyrhizobium sp. USDA 4341]